jgi:hypothetical protein
VRSIVSTAVVDDVIHRMPAAPTRAIVRRSGPSSMRPPFAAATALATGSSFGRASRHIRTPATVTVAAIAMKLTRNNQRPSRRRLRGRCSGITVTCVASSRKSMSCTDPRASSGTVFSSELHGSNAGGVAARARRLYKVCTHAGISRSSCIARSLCNG